MFCSDHGLDDDQRIHFAIYQLMVMFILPTALMIYCYTVVIYVLWISGRTLINMTSTYRYCLMLPFVCICIFEYHLFIKNQLFLQKGCQKI